MNVLVTGHKGFIGSEVYSLLSERGHSVTGFDLGDELQQKKYDYIAHFAARTLIILSKEKPYEYFLDNMGLTMRIIELSRTQNSKLIFPPPGFITLGSTRFQLT